MLGSLVALLGFAFIVLTALGWLRKLWHRPPPALGDEELTAQLDLLTGRRTRRLAVAVVDPTIGTRTAYVDADEHTRFEIGSITKGFTGMLVAEALARGELGLDSTVADLAPDLAGSPLGSVTVRELCTHTSGLPQIHRTPGMVARAVASGWFGTDPYRGVTAPVLLRHATRQRLVRRGRVRYSNLGAAVLGQLLGRAAGSDYATLLAERICGPLGMDGTRLGRPGDAARRGWTAAGRRSQPWLMDGYGPAGGLVSDLADMTRLASGLLDGSAPGRSATEPIGRFEPDRPDRASAMFWVVDTAPGTSRTMVWHNGETGGYSAFLAIYPRSGRAVVVLADIARAVEQERIVAALIRWLISAEPRS